MSTSGDAPPPGGAMPPPAPRPPATSTSLGYTENPMLAKATVTRSTPGGAGVTKLLADAPPPPSRRGKIPLEKGFSQVDWLRTARESAATRPPTRDVTPADVAAATARGECWAALRGKVYDLAPYLRFHPGGAALLEAAAGTDCTAAFNDAHAWVNGDALLASCLIGPLKAGGGGGGGGGGEGGGGGGNGSLPHAPLSS